MKKIKIDNLTIKESGDYVVVSADCKIRLWKKDKVYFKFDKKYKDFISLDYAPFVSAFLIPAMKLGVDIEIDGVLSAKLTQGMGEIMHTYLSWKSNYKKIQIHTKGVSNDNFPSTKNASFFSGGVDSFYTYLKNKDEGNKIDYFILANGFDINLKNTKLWEQTSRNVEQISEEEGVGLIKIESNIRDIIEPIELWDFTHGGALASLGLLLRKELKNVYIGSTYSDKDLFAWGSHPKIDKNWSTETISFYHHGSEVTRLQKVKYISNNLSAQNHLRVCYLNKKGEFNCGKCDKCFRTMINLELANSLPRFKTFPNKIDIEAFSKIKIEGEHGAIFHQENLDELKTNGSNLDLQNIIEDLLKNKKDVSEYNDSSLFRRLMYLDFYLFGGLLYKVYNQVRFGL